MNSSNKHLKSKIDEINNFVNEHNYPPEDLYESFLSELKVSKLHVPSIMDGDNVNFEHLESDDGLKVLPLFTSPDEYMGDNEMMSFEFSFYAGIIADCDFDGAVINPDGDEVFVPRKITETLRVQPSGDVDDDEIYDAYQLKDIAYNAKNEALLNFIQDESNFNNFDGLIELLSQSSLLNVVSSREDLCEAAHDGIIITLEIGGFNLSVKSTSSERYGLLFTSIDAIRETCDTDAGLHYYCQVTSFEKILKFILVNDLDGMIINPYLDDYYIPRNILLDIYENHPEIIRNPKFLGATFYAFPLNTI